ncbi:cupin domain-containing protein [Rhodococcus sp. NPDC060086]|uniref:cupin domain-containing protein n=1 Tax=Rhodococcus sp. NPDC060086 TaxID=3347055 RepID=UPI00364FCE9D
MRRAPTRPLRASRLERQPTPRRSLSETESTDQVLTFVSGTGEAVLNGHTHMVEAGDQCAIAAGARHNFRNIGDEPLVLYTMYSPPEHAAGENEPGVERS